MTSLKPCPMERWVVSLSRPRVFQRADPLTSTSPVAPPLSHGRGSFTVDLNFASESQADEFRVSGPARNALLALSPPPTPGAPHLARFSRDVGFHRARPAAPTTKQICSLGVPGVAARIHLRRETQVS